MADADYKFASIKTELGEGALMLDGLVGREAISEPFSFQLSLRSVESEIPFADIVSQKATIEIPFADGEPRFINGIFSNFTKSWGSFSDGERNHLYTATLVPNLWLLARSQTSRIFQGKSVPEIVEDVLKANEINSYRLDLKQADYVARDYCVQYRETDFNFISRLLEEEGIYYYFEHTEDDHLLVLADGLVKPAVCAEDGAVTGVEIRYELRSGRHSMRDFEFQDPGLDLSATLDSGGEAAFIPTSREVYDYSTGAIERGSGDPAISRERLERLNRLRLEEEETQVIAIKGTSTRRTLVSGLLVALEHEPANAELEDKSFLLTAIEHSATREAAELAAEGEGEIYTNRFECIDSDTPYRPRRIAKKPMVQGPQTAIVVGPDGEDKAHTDPHGRVKVKFHWDLNEKSDDTTSCWIRVSHPWAGKGWGAISIPHVGHEVIVDFLEGDPDRPVVTGRVYHGLNTVPMELAEGGPNRHKSVMRDNYGNEVVLDATPGDEHIRIYSPHHESMIQVGKSVRTFSDSDSKGFEFGNKFEATIGHKYELIAGHQFGALVGLSSSAMLGGNVGVLFGASVAAHVGPAFSYRWGDDIDNSDGVLSTYSDKHNVVAAKGRVNLLGGVSTSGNSSILDMHATQASLSVGPNKNPSTMPSPKGVPAKVLGASALASVMGVANAVGTSVLTSGKKAETAEHVFLGYMTAVELAIDALLVSYLATLGAASKEKISPKSHTDSGGDKPESMINMNSEGEMEIKAIKSIQLRIPDAMPQGKPNSGFAAIGMSGKNNIQLRTKEDANDKSGVDLKLEEVKILSGKKMSLITKSGGNMEFKSAGDIIFDSPVCTINKSLKVT